ncbi:MAG: replicative DNA helicase Mcm, partial [Natronomonas sp.]
MARADDTELIDSFEEFYRSYYRNEIAELAQKYPNEQKSLYIDWQDLYRFDSDLADDFRNKPDQLREYAEEALRLYDLPVDVSLGQAHVRVRNLPEATDIRGIRSDHRGMLISVQGIIRKATDVRPKITTAAFECQRCGTLTRIPQEGGDFQEPHECQGCERQGPFRINYDQSEFIDAQKLRVQESPEGLRGGETPQNIDVNIEDDITGEVTPGDHVTAAGILKLEQQGNDREKSAMFDVYMEGLTVDIEDEQFEEMEITDEDKKEIVELSNQGDIYEQMIGAIAPSIYGYEKEKKAMAFQLFSGVTKFLPDGSRTRGDLHILLVGDPGTGKSQLLQYIKEIAPRSVYTSGKGSSSAGLTAAAVRDDFGEGQQWTLEAGALVLADQGIAAVDELDKMRSEDQSAMHEALEQQSYHPSSEVLLSDGRRVEVGEFVDEKFEANPEQVVDGVDCEILPTDDIGVHTVDLKTTEVTKTDVDRVSRHEAPDEFVRVTFSNGRDVLVTPEHPMF